MINRVRVQDVERLDAHEGVKVIRGIEARIIMLAMEHADESLNESDAPNPLADVRNLTRTFCLELAPDRINVNNYPTRYDCATAGW